MRQGESILSRKIRNALRARGHWVWKTHGSQFSEPGIPDLIGYRLGDGRFIGIETKIKSEISESQSQFLNRCAKITNQGARIGIAKSVAQGIAIVENPEWIDLFGDERHR